MMTHTTTYLTEMETARLPPDVAPASSGAATHPPPSAYLTEIQTARLLQVHRRTLQRWREIGGGPPYTRLGERRIVYSADAIRRWAEANTFDHYAAEFASEAA